jgi:8-oxo-dGTP diphosphatase
MGKSVRTPIVAAGGIVIRTGARPLVAVVQRRRDNAWVLPKGKLKPNEKPVAAARREAIEETGSDVRVYEYLGVISYIGGSGPKVTHFWRMHAVGSAAGKPMDDIKAVEWLPLSTAIERLNLAHEQSFLRSIGRKAPKKSREQARSKPPAKEIALPAAEVAPAIKERAPPPATRPGGAAGGKAREVAAALAGSAAADQTLAVRRWTNAAGWLTASPGRLSRRVGG